MMTMMRRGEMFVFKQKTAYEMRISDWSSGVCSSDLIDASHIAAVRLRVAPLVRDLCDKKQIATGLEGKFSVYHAASIGLVRGKAGLAEFTDETVNDPLMRQVRERVQAVADPAMPEDSVHVEVSMQDRKSTRLNSSH